MYTEPTINVNFDGKINTNLYYFYLFYLCTISILVSHNTLIDGSDSYGLKINSLFQMRPSPTTRVSRILYIPIYRVFRGSLAIAHRKIEGTKLNQKVLYDFPIFPIVNELLYCISPAHRQLRAAK